MNDSMQLSKSTSLKRVYSDGDLFLIQNDVNKKYYPEIVERYNLETPGVNVTTKRDLNQAFSTFLLRLFDYIDNLHIQINGLKEHVRSFSNQQLVIEDQNTILSRQLIRRRNDIKKLNMQLNNCEQHVDHYRHLFNKYNISDSSVIERLTATNRSLQEELQIQQKKVYLLEQQLLSLSKEKDHLAQKNKLLYDTICSKDYQLVAREERKETARKKKKNSKSWFSSFSQLFHKKKTGLKEGEYESVLPKPRVSSSLSTETSSMGSMPLMKEDIRMLRRASTHSRNSSDGLIPCHSTSYLIGVNNESIQKRVSKTMKERTRSEHVDSQDSTGGTSGSECCIHRDSSNDSHYAIHI